MNKIHKTLTNIAGNLRIEGNGGEVIVNQKKTAGLIGCVVAVAVGFSHSGC